MSDKQSEDKSSAEYFAGLFVGTAADKVLDVYRSRFSIMLSAVNFKLLYGLLKDKSKGTDREREVESLPKVIVETWRQHEVSLLRAEHEEYKKHSTSTLGQLFGSMVDPDKTLKERLSKLTLVANEIVESLTDDGKQDEQKEKR